MNENEIIAFVYKDLKENFQNRKEKQYSYVPIIFIYFGNSIIEADKAFLAKIGKNPQKTPYIGCQPVTLDKFSDFISPDYSQKAKKIQEYQVEVQNLNYVIYGWENPSIKPQPEYHI